jgi:hypothetical protein
MKNKNIMVGLIIILAIAIICVIAIAILLVINNSSRKSNIPPTLDINTAIAEAAGAFTPTPDKPLSTPSRTLTFTPRPTRTRLPTWTPTNTPRPFPTRTEFPTITPTRATEKPGEGLGDPTWIDEFQTDDYWTLFDDECFKTEVQGGKYIQTTKRVPAGACWEVSWPKIQDFYLETVARVTSGCAERDRYGIFFRGVNTRTGYMFGITCKQEYWLSFWDSETYQRTTLIDYSVSDKIKIEPGEANKLGVQTTGDRIVLYINDALVAEAYDSTYIDQGLIGFFIGSEVTEAFRVEYDYLAYWASP